MSFRRILIAFSCFSLAACAASIDPNESTGESVFGLAADDDGCTGKPWKCGAVAEPVEAKPIPCETCHGAWSGYASIRAAEQRNNIFDETHDFDRNALPPTPRCPTEQQRYPAGCYPCDGSICCPAAVADRLMQSTADDVADVAYDVRKALFGHEPTPDLQCTNSQCCKACSYVYGGWYCYPHAC